VSPTSASRRRWILDTAAVLGPALFLPGAALASLRFNYFDYPERPVREFLTLHFAGSRAFTARGMDGKERFLSRKFRRAIFAFFERGIASDSSLRMVTDPFTGSQGAADYLIGDARVRAEKAWVPVRMSDGSSSWTLTYHLRNDQERNDERWRIHDVEDRRGMLLTDALDTLK
jgi:hypothetical protein